MPLYRDEAGLVFEADPRFADSMGYSPVDALEEESINAQHGLDARYADRGASGAVDAVANRFASGASLGMSDMLLGQVMTPNEREMVLADIKNNPHLSAGAEFAGALLPGLASEGALASTPTGYLSRLAGSQVEKGLAQGGIAGTARALTAMGSEGAVQSAGQYLGHAALANKEVTAEGLNGALGTGYAFGALGGGAALGVTKGVMAGRRLFSRAMGAEDAKAAESAWTQAHQEALDADTATQQTVQAKLDELRTMKAEALRYKNTRKAMTREEAIRAEAARGMPQEAGPAGETAVSQTSSAEAAVGPEPLTDITTGGAGGQTSVFRKPEAIEFDGELAKAFDASMPERGVGPEPLAEVGAQPSGTVTSVFKRPAGVDPGVASDLEAALAGTKAQLDKGVELKDIGGLGNKENAVPGSAVSPQIPPGKTPRPYEGRNPSRNIEEFLAEKAADDAGTSELPAWKRGNEARDARLKELMKKLGGDAKIPKASQNPAELATRYAPEHPNWGEKYDFPKKMAFSQLRSQLTKQLLGAPIAKIETELVDALEEFEKARKDYLDIATKDFKVAEPAVPRDFMGPAPSGKTASGEDIAALRASDKTGVGKKSAAAIERAHEEALLRAQQAANPREAGQALYEADQLEKLLEHLDTTQQAPGVPRDFLDDLGQQAKVIDRYEKASAKLAEAAGDGAHPISIEKAKAYAAAGDDAVRAATERATRAVDDAETFGPYEEMGPKASTPKERVIYAKERQLEADKAYADRSADVQEAEREAQKANAKVKAGEKNKKAILRAEAKATQAGGKSGLAEKVGALEWLDLPGMPKVSDLPVVGPLLGAWLKYRTLRAAIGRKIGKVPATADNRVAALASRTRDRVARAVDRSLGVLERGAKQTTRAMPAAAAVLSTRIFDDGGHDPKKGAPLPELAGARIRELAAYVATPGAIEKDVRRELRGVVDPDLIAAAEKHRRVMMEYLLASVPKGPEQGLVNTVKWQPSPAESMAFARRVEAVSDPAGTMERLAEQQQMLSLEAAEAMRKVYPQLLLQAQERALQHIAQNQANIPYRLRVQMSLLYQQPFDAALSPDNLKITQSVYERKPSSPAYNPGAAPAAAPPTATPSIANPVDMSQAYMPAADKNALRR